MTSSQSSSFKLHEQVVAGDAGIVDEDIELAHRRFGCGTSASTCVLVGEIARQHMDALAELACELLERLARACRTARPSRPAPCSARAIAPPMPPVAPVTSAVLPVRSNIAALLLARCIERFRRARALNAATSSGVPMAAAGRALGDALDQARQHLAGADLVESA